MIFERGLCEDAPKVESVIVAKKTNENDTKKINSKGNNTVKQSVNT